MAKSTLLNFTQNLNIAQVTFDYSNPLNIIAVSTVAPGANLTPGSHTFTANSFNLAANAQITAATFTATVGGVANTIITTPVVTNTGSYYLNAPSSPNSANADTGAGIANSTFNFVTGILSTLYTGAGNDSVVKAINVSSTDSVARLMSFWVNTGTGGDKLVATINIPAGAGTTNGNTAAVDVLAGTLLPSLPYDSNGKRVYPLKTGTILKVSVPTVTAGNNIFVQAIAEDY